VTARNNGYTWDWQEAQRTAKTMRDLLTQAYGYQKDPDAYMMQIYQPNSWDILAALNSLVSGYVPDGIPIPAEKIFVKEFATSSSLAAAPNGNGIPSFGDDQTPTTTVAGHSQWLNSALCSYSAAGIQKYAYWSLYDPYTTWTSAPWSKTGDDLAWNGFWGLSYEGAAYGDKPAWAILASFYANNYLNCPYTPSAAPPIVSLTPSSDYYTLGQPVRVTWTAADVASLSLSQGHGASYSCEPDQTAPAPLSQTGLAGSCAYTDTPPFYTTGPQTLTLTGTNGVGGSQNAYATVTIGSAPIVNAVTDWSYAPTIHANSGIIVWGNGFSLTGGNTIQLTRPGYSDVWLYNGDGHYFWDKSHSQINAALDGRAAPGEWTVYVRNGYSGIPSAAYVITILP